MFPLLPVRRALGWEEGGESSPVLGLAVCLPGGQALVCSQKPQKEKVKVPFFGSGIAEGWGCGAAYECPMCSCPIAALLGRFSLPSRQPRRYVNAIQHAAYQQLVGMGRTARGGSGWMLGKGLEQGQLRSSSFQAQL